MNPKGDIKPDEHQLSTCFVTTQMNQRIAELNLFSTADSVINKNPNLKICGAWMQLVFVIQHI